MTRENAAIQFPLRVRCLFWFASATIIIVGFFVRRVFLFVCFGRQERTDHSRVGRLEGDEKKQTTVECLHCNDDGFCPSRQIDTRQSNTQFTVFYFMLFVYAVRRRRTCNDLRIIFVVTWLVLKWTKVQYFVGTRRRNPFQPSINFCNVVWWCVGRLWAYVSCWANNKEECEMGYIEHKRFEIETLYTLIWQGHTHLNWSGSQSQVSSISHFHYWRHL